MAKRVIKYTYRSFILGCQCCSDLDSYYDMWEDGILIEENVCCELTEDEDDLRKHLTYLEPFEVDQESEWF